MAKSLTPVFFLLLLNIVSFTQGANFKCSGPVAKCRALAGYVPTDNTSYSEIQKLFQVDSILDLFGANGIPPTSPASTSVAAGASVFVPFPCSCTEGRGISDRRPIYTVLSNDTLYLIATVKFGQLVKYPEIAEINKIPDANKITIGQELWIPLPCSCDPVGDFPVKHLAHLVKAGSSLADIAAMYGTTESVLLKVNNMSDPKKLMADEVLDVPLRVCNSSIRSDAVDRSLGVADGKYALTAGSCVQCSCRSSSWQLDCKIANSSSNNSVCGVPSCGGSLKLGESSGSGCASIRCDYGGYYNTSGLNITTVAATNQSFCEKSSASKFLPLLRTHFAALLVLFSL